MGKYQVKFHYCVCVHNGYDKKTWTLTLPYICLLKVLEKHSSASPIMSYLVYGVCVCIEVHG